MAVNTTTNLADSLISRYRHKYEKNVKVSVAYDQLAEPFSKSIEEMQRATDVNLTFLSEMDPATSAISETADVTPEQLVDTTASLTPTSRWGAIQDSEKLMLTNHVGYGMRRMKIVANNAAEGIDILARAAALQGGVVSRAAARASLDAGEATHRCTEARFAIAEARLGTMKSPAFVDGNMKKWSAIMPEEAFYDLRAGGNVVNIAVYQKANIILNSELGSIGKFKIVVPDWPKVFGGAGIDNGSVVATTLDGAVVKMATEVEVAANTNIVVGAQLTIGTEETANTFYPTNERVFVTSVSGTTIGVAGSGSNGGLRYSHATGVAVRNADSVYPVAFGGPSSLMKVYAKDVGEFGDIVLKKQGLLNQFFSVGWKWYGQYGVMAENRILRGEFASSMDA